MLARALDIDGHDDRRADHRHSVSLPPVRLEGAATVEHVHLVNVARRGFLARASARYQTGERVKLHLQGKAVEARIVWCAQGRIGGRFIEPLDHRDLAGV
jgi:hypothetical protein